MHISGKNVIRKKYSNRYILGNILIYNLHFLYYEQFLRTFGSKDIKKKLLLKKQLKYAKKLNIYFYEVYRITHDYLAAISNEV